MDLEIARGSVSKSFYTIVHIPAKIAPQAGVLETWAIVIVNMKSLTPFALVWHNAHTLASPVFAVRSPLEQVVSGYWSLPHWKQAVHIVWEVRSSSKSLHKKSFAVHSSDVRGRVCDGRHQITFDFEQRQFAVSLPLSLIAHSHVTKISMGVGCVMLMELQKVVTISVTS